MITDAQFGFKNCYFTPDAIFNFELYHIEYTFQIEKTIVLLSIFNVFLTRSIDVNYGLN